MCIQEYVVIPTRIRPNKVAESPGFRSRARQAGLEPFPTRTELQVTSRRWRVVYTPRPFLYTTQSVPTPSMLSLQHQ